MSSDTCFGAELIIGDGIFLFTISMLLASLGIQTVEQIPQLGTFGVATTVNHRPNIKMDMMNPLQSAFESHCGASHSWPSHQCLTDPSPQLIEKRAKSRKWSLSPSPGNSSTFTLL